MVETTTQLFIAAGGKGNRLGKYTENLPKSMVEVAGRPLVDHIIATAKTARVKQIVVGVDDGKEMLIKHLLLLPDVILRKGCVEPLTVSFFQSAKDLHPDIICGCNGDTLFYPESLELVIKILQQDKNAAGAVLLTTATRIPTSSNWKYWRHRLLDSVLIDMEETPGHLIPTEYVVSAYRTTALKNFTANFTQDYRDWRNLPFRCYSWGWDYILRLLLWKNFRVAGRITDHPCLNVNSPIDIEEGRLFYEDPALFRKLRTTMRKNK